MSNKLPKTIKLTSFNDPGHGWLRVSIDLFKKVAEAAKDAVLPANFYSRCDGTYADSFTDLISRCSYQSDTNVFLEEDCDASNFLVLLASLGYSICCKRRDGTIEPHAYFLKRFEAKKGLKVVLSEKYGNSESAIREYGAYSPDLFDVDFSEGLRFRINRHDSIVENVKLVGTYRKRYYLLFSEFNGCNYKVPKAEIVKYVHSVLEDAPERSVAV